MLGEQTGLDTRVVPAVNDADSVMLASSQPSAEAVKSAAWGAVARLKLKGIGGGAPQGVKPAVQLESTPGILPGRQQSEGQAEDFTRQAERRCMAVASSCREVSC